MGYCCGYILPLSSISLFPAYSFKVANGKIQNLEVMVEALLHNEGKLKETVLHLERERKALLETLQEFHTQPANPSGKTLPSEQERRDAAK